MAPRVRSRATARARAGAAAPAFDRGEETRGRIVSAALHSFAERGFDGASTREISGLAGVNQGLITYHFRSKESLWKAAVDSMFAELAQEFGELASEISAVDVREQLRELVVRWVRFAARHPEQMRIMVQEGKADGPRLRWLVSRHLKGFYALFEALVARARAAGLVAVDLPTAHLYYIVIGAASTIFTAAPECRRLTGHDPESEAAIEAHGRALVTLLLGARPESTAPGRSTLPSSAARRRR